MQRSYKFYGQLQEDKAIYERYFRNVRNGVFLEMGALDGVTYSNTKFFEDSLGWRGVLIEPLPEKFALINRPNSKAYNCIVSTHRGPMDLYVNGAVSSVKDFTSPEFYKGWHEPNQSKTITVQSVPLSDILHHAGVRKIDFWSLDVEGSEYEVLQTMDWSIPVRVLCIERVADAAVDAKCDALLLEKGFRYDGSLAHNKVWVK